MPALNSLVSQNTNQSPPQIQGADSQQPSGLQGLTGQAPQQQFQAPSHEETVALLQHMSAFHRRWMQMLKDPEIGTKDMRGDVQDMMADMMADDYASLPEVMGLLKQIPTNPLEQKQWIEKHIQNDELAMQIVLTHRAQAAGGQMTMGPGTVDESNRSMLVKGAVSRYKNNKRPAGSSARIPVNG